MKIKKIIILISVLALQSCTMSFAPSPKKPKDYQIKGIPNLKITTKNSSSFSQDLYLLLHEFYPGCKFRQLGLISVSSNEVLSIHIPEGNRIEILGGHGEFSWLLNRNQSSSFFHYLKVVPNQKYELDFNERNGSTGSTLFKIQKNERIEIENDEAEKCKEYKELE